MVLGMLDEEATGSRASVAKDVESGCALVSDVGWHEAPCRGLALVKPSYAAESGSVLGGQLLAQAEGVGNQRGEQRQVAFVAAAVPG